MSESNVSALLADEKAHWMASEHAGLLPDESIVREWRNIPLQARSECIAYLRGRTTVTNPKAHTKEYAGTWRVLKIEDIVERNKAGGMDSLTMRETLADEYATTVVGAFTRLAGDDVIYGTGTTEAANIAHPSGTAPIQENWRKITIRWKDLNHDSLDAIMAERTTVYTATLTVGTETKTGPWYLIRRKPSWEDDGTGVYEETWSLDEWHLESKGKTGNTKDSVARYIYAVPKDRVKTALDAEISALGATYGAQGYTYDQKIYWREENADIITEVSKAIKIEFASFTSEKDDSKVVSEVSGENLFDADMTSYAIGTVDQGHTIRLQKSRNNDGTINATKVDALAVKQEVTQYDSEVGFSATEKTKQGKNLFDGDVSGYEITQTSGKILKRQHVINSDGTYDDVVIERASIDQTASTDSTHSDQHLDADNRTEDTEVHTAAAATIADVDFATQGTIVETQNRPNEDGTYRTEKKTVVSKEQEIDDITLVEDKFRQIKADIGKQIKDATLALNYGVSATTGEIVRRSISENADGTFDVERNRDIAKTVADSETSSEISLFEKVTTAIDRNNVAGDTPPVSQTAGTIVKVTNRINEYDRVDVSVETRTSINVEESQKQTSATAFEKSSLVVDRNESTAETPITVQTAGKIETVTSRKNDFGEYDNTIEIRESVLVETSEKETSATAFVKRQSVLDRNESTAETPITVQTAGKIETVRARLNEFGKYDNTVDVQESITVSDVDKSKTISLFETRTEATDRHQENAVTPENSQTAGTIVTTRSQKDEFGRYTNTTETRDSTNITEARKETRATAFEKVEAITDRSDAAAETPITGQTAGTIKTATSIKNDFGEYDNTLETRTSVSQTVTHASFSGALTTESTSNVRNADAKAEATGGGSGTIVSVSSRINEFGKYDNETQTRTGVSGNISEYSHARFPDWSAKLAIYKNSVAAPSLGAAEYGEVRYEKNEYGLYDGHKIVRTYAVDESIYVGATGLTEIHVQSRDKPSDKTKDQYRTVTSTFNLGYAATQGAAFMAITGGLNGSGVDKVAKNVYMYKKVTSIVASAWQDTDDGSYEYPTL